MFTHMVAYTHDSAPCFFLLAKDLYVSYYCMTNHPYVQELNMTNIYHLPASMGHESRRGLVGPEDTFGVFSQYGSQLPPAWMIQKECEQHGKHGISYNLISAMTYYHFFHSLLVTQTNLDAMREKIMQEHKYWEMRTILRAISKTGSHTLKSFCVD